MPLADRLADLLQKSREPVLLADRHARLLDTTTPDDRAAAICTEIEETVLARKLTFRVGSNAELVIDAGGRRMMRVIHVTPDSMAPTGNIVFETRDDARLAQQMPALGRILAAVCAQDGQLTVTSDLPDGLYPTGAVGFPPDRLYDATVSSAKIKPPAPKPATLKPAAVKAAPPTEPTPAIAEPPKFSPTEAMKAMIRDKVKAATTAAAVAAATNPGPAKVIAPMISKGTGTMSNNRLRAFFAEVQNDVSFCAVLNGDGNVEAVGGKENDERILAFASDVMTDLDHWRDTTTKVLSQEQIIVMKAAGIQNQSLAYFSADSGAVIVIFLNTDLSRIFMVANKFLASKGSA